MISWLNIPLFGLARWAWIAMGATALAIFSTIVIKTWDHKTDKLVTIATQNGQVIAQNKGQQITLDQVSKANDAEKKLAIPGDLTAYNICMRDSLPEYRGSCTRYKSQ